jgi:hypothetical protein
MSASMRQLAASKRNRVMRELYTRVASQEPTPEDSAEFWTSSSLTVCGNFLEVNSSAGDSIPRVSGFWEVHRVR